MNTPDHDQVVWNCAEELQKTNGLTPPRFILTKLLVQPFYEGLLWRNLQRICCYSNYQKQKVKWMIPRLLVSFMRSNLLLVWCTVKTEETHWSDGNENAKQSNNHAFIWPFVWPLAPVNNDMPSNSAGWACMNITLAYPVGYWMHSSVVCYWTWVTR